MYRSGRYLKIGLILSFSLFLLIVITTTAFTQEVKNPDTIINVKSVAVDSLEPVYAYESASLGPIQNLYEPLIAYKRESTNEFVPLLATKVPTRENGLISEDGLTYTFPIREGVKFHNGDELTAEDVEYSFERAMVVDPAGGPIYLILNVLLGVYSSRGGEGLQITYEQIDEAVEVEGNNVVFHLARPVPYLLQIWALPYCSIVDKSWMIEQGGWPGTEGTWKDYNNPEPKELTLFDKANGTGPYKLERWDKRNEIVFTRNEGYWRDPAKIEKVIIKNITEWSTRKLMLQTGDADIVSVPRQFLPQVKMMEGVRVREGLSSLTITSIFFNQKINPEGNKYIGSGKLDGNGIPTDFFDNIDIRKAFNYAFDWDALIEDVYSGAAVQSKGPVPRGVLYHNPDQDVYNFDLEKATELFKEAYGGKLWEVGFEVKAPYVSGTSEYKAALEILASNLNRINQKFNLEPVALSWPTLYEAEQSKWVPMDTGYWTNDYPDPDNDVFGLMHSDGYYSSKQGFSKYDELVEKGVTTLDPAERKEIYYELQKLAYEDAIDIFLVQNTGWHVSRDWLQGWYRYPPQWGTDMEYYYQLWKE